MAKKESELLVVQFLVPLCDRAGKRYPRSVQRRIWSDLQDRFDGWSLASDKPLQELMRRQ